MLKNKIQTLLIATFLCLSTIIMAQTISPYTQYGLGDQRSTAFSINRGMGGISAGFIDSRNINYTNPASYAGINYTIMEVGANLQSNVIGDTTGSILRATNGGISHVAFAFPIKLNHWGMSFGLLPYSNVNYKFDSQSTVNDINFTNTNKGEGSLYQFYVGQGVKIGKVNIGLNGAVLFGDMDYTSSVSFEDSLNFNKATNHTQLRVRDFMVNAGVQYRTKINKLENRTLEKEDVFMTIGLYGAPPLNIKTKSAVFLDANVTSIVSGEDLPVDTASGGTFEEKGVIKLPASIGAGVTFGNENTWTLGADFHFENWNKYQSPLSNQPSTVNEWKVKVGGQIIPKFNGDRYGQRIEYRLGVHYGNTKIQIDNKALTDVGMAFGVSLPFKKYKALKRSLSSLNLSLELGKRGNIKAGNLKENYYKITIAYTLSDRWFVKRKFD